MPLRHFCCCCNFCHYCQKYLSVTSVVAPLSITTVTKAPLSLLLLPQLLSQLLLMPLCHFCCCRNFCHCYQLFSFCHFCCCRNFFNYCHKYPSVTSFVAVTSVSTVTNSPSDAEKVMLWEPFPGGFLLSMMQGRGVIMKQYSTCICRTLHSTLHVSAILYTVLQYTTVYSNLVYSAVP